MNDDTAASLQMAHDEAVHLYGPDSIQALDAERAARQFFNKGKPAPVTPVVQRKEVSPWVSSHPTQVAAISSASLPASTSVAATR